MQAGPSPEAVAVRRPAVFRVSYLNPPSLTGAFWYAWQTMLVVLLVVGGGPIWVWRVSASCVLRLVKEPSGGGCLYGFSHPNLGVGSLCKCRGLELC